MLVCALQSRYMKRVPNRRMDSLIELLLRVEADYYLKYKRVQFGFLTSKADKQTQARLQRATELAAGTIRQLSPTTFTVPSSDSKSPAKVVVWRPSTLQFRCCRAGDSKVSVAEQVRSSCTHAFACNCPDFVKTAAPCKHCLALFRWLHPNADIPQPVSASSSVTLPDGVPMSTTPDLPRQPASSQTSMDFKVSSSVAGYTTSCTFIRHNQGTCPVLIAGVMKTLALQ
jgi:hypothetical protein